MACSTGSNLLSTPVLQPSLAQECSCSHVSNVAFSIVAWSTAPHRSSYSCVLYSSLQNLCFSIPTLAPCPSLADIALMQFFGALDNQSSMPNRSALNPRTDDRGNRVCRTIGSFAVYMHDYGLDKFDSRFRDDMACWNVTAFNDSTPLQSSCNNTADRQYTWWCNKRPNNPCVFNCPNQVRCKAYLTTVTQLAIIHI